MSQTAASTFPVTPKTPAMLWQGALWKVGSMACFALINGIVRYWSGGAATDHGTLDSLPVNVMIFFQNLFGVFCLLPWILKAGLQGLSTSYKGMHFLRAFSAVLGVSLWFFSLKEMPLAESVALSFTGPIFTVIGAWMLLHEHITVRRLCAIALSLSGAFIISRPDLALQSSESLGLAVFLPLGSALSLAYSKLLTRKLTLLGEQPSTLAAALLILMTPASLPLALIEWQAPQPQHWPWLALLGLLAAASHFSFGKAYQLADVSFLAPFGFSKFMMSALVGYLVFQEFPKSWSLWLGMSIILCSIAVLHYKMPLYSEAKRLRSS